MCLTNDKFTSLEIIVVDLKTNIYILFFYKRINIPGKGSELKIYILCCYKYAFYLHCTAWKQTGKKGRKQYNFLPYSLFLCNKIYFSIMINIEANCCLTLPMRLRVLEDSDHERQNVGNHKQEQGAQKYWTTRQWT